ncbi:26949_t:CDS:2 [Gigaspora margarita]|uniref:26949_t:CDS:1 n=1 Tax=Gigaspora margarita TaxID=4874 RepID=A0ABN7UQJ3_GIGMA|nr:26949_t:CDS:2 [Gigaspora margarita]
MPRLQKQKHDPLALPTPYHKNNTKREAANWYRQIVEVKDWIILKAHQAGFIGRISSLKKDNTALVNH